MQSPKSYVHVRGEINISRATTRCNETRAAFRISGGPYLSRLQRPFNFRFTRHRRAPKGGKEGIPRREGEQRA